MSIRRLSVLIPALVAMFAVGLSVRAEGRPVEIGKPAPGFTLTSADGKTISLKDYKGKIVVLEWTCPTCPFVVRHHKRLKTTQKLSQTFKDKGVVWLAIDSSKTASAEVAAEHAKENKISYPILIDRDGKVGKLYDAKTTPHMFVINRQGNLAYAGAMDDDPRGNNPERQNYVEAAVKSLLDGSTVAQTRVQSYGCSVKYAK
ncbi:MAG: thioredoxin family protein [Planctomycetes bacterium]|nr:thioredoxin family protein [Planctomycetota bacterium]